MSNAAEDGPSAQSGGQNDRYHRIVFDLVSLIGHVQASMKLVESAIASEALADDQEMAANIVVLDDVTPRYVKANTALTACNAGLGAALHVLLDADACDPPADSQGALIGRIRRGSSRGAGAVIRPGVVPPHPRP
jgi:hypothetical protein